MKTIGDKIREVLEAKGMKQADLARSTGISTGLISSIINNQRTSVMVDTLQKITKALDVPSSYFFEDETDVKPDILSALSEQEQGFFPGEEKLPWIFAVDLNKQKAALPSPEKWARLRALCQETKDEGLPLDKVWQIINTILEEN